MKTLISIGVAMIFMSTPYSDYEASPSFKFIKTEKEITLSSRWITTQNKIKTREIRAEFTIYAPPDKVVEIIGNATIAKQWMKHLDESSVVKRVSENSWYTYLKYEIPWPLIDQDCIIFYNKLKDTDGKSYTLNLKGMPNFLPVKPGVTRISHLAVCWKIKSGANNQSLVIYTAYSEQQTGFPRWIVDPLLQNNLILTMSSLKELAESQRNK